MSAPDIRFENHGSIWLARYLSDAGESWLTEYVQTDQTWGEAIVIEHRFVKDIIEGAARDGLAVEVA